MFASKTSRARHRRLRCDELEGRLVPAIAFDATTGILTIQGSESADTVSVTRSIWGTVDEFDDRIIASWTHGDVTESTSIALWRLLQVPNSNIVIPIRRVTKVVFQGYGGHDYFSNGTDIPVSADGGSGNDTLYGGSGNDTLTGGANEDKLYGANGSDSLAGGSSNDSLYGAAGNDTLSASTGDDLLDGGAEDDTLYGSDGNDTLTGGSGADRLEGGANADRLTGGRQNDTLLGGTGNDLLDGDEDADELRGNSGADTLYGSAGDDELFGDADNDGLYGGDGENTLTGGTGADRFLVHPWLEQLAEFHWLLHTDAIEDQANEDARITFEDGEQVTATLLGESWTFEAYTWIERRIEQADEALAALHRRTGNTRLLKMPGGGELTFVRVSRLICEGGCEPADIWEGGYGGWNEGNGRITITAYGFDHWDNDRGGNNGLVETIFHEVGHNWDSGRSWTAEFRALSGWEQADNNDLIRMAMSGTLDLFLATHTPGTDPTEDWYYLNIADFASDYARTNPNEDFAETFAAYFMDEVGLPFRGGADDTGADEIPDKIDFLDGVLDGLM